jgi:hypothetical protein
MSEKTVCELPKNSREAIHVRLGEFKGHKFVDMRVFVTEDGKDPAPTRKGLAVSPPPVAEIQGSLGSS